MISKVGDLRMEFVIGLIIAGVIILAVFGTAAFLVLRAVHAARRAADSLAGQVAAGIAKEILTDEKGNLSLNLDLVHTQPPRSISDMTSLYAPMIARDFPDMNIRQIISAAENKLIETLTAIGEGPVRGSADNAAGPGTDSGYAAFPNGQDASFSLGVTQEFDVRVQRRIESLRSENKEEHFEGIRIHKTGINKYTNEAGTCVIMLQTAVEYLHYITQNGSVASGSPEVPEQARYNLELIYIADENRLASPSATSVGINCPNCGAPVRGVGQKRCEYCGTALHTIDIRIWRMNGYSEC